MCKGKTGKSLKMALMDCENDTYTDQEIRVAELSAQGKSDEEIAAILETDPEHVRDIKEMIIAKIRATIWGC